MNDVVPVLANIPAWRRQRSRLLTARGLIEAIDTDGLEAEADVPIVTGQQPKFYAFAIGKKHNANDSIFASAKSVFEALRIVADDVSVVYNIRSSTTDGSGIEFVLNEFLSHQNGAIVTFDKANNKFVTVYSLEFIGVKTNLSRAVATTLIQAMDVFVDIHDHLDQKASIAYKFGRPTAQESVGVIFNLSRRERGFKL